MSKLPALPGMRVHNGTPVPYVARWSAENPGKATPFPDMRFVQALTPQGSTVWVLDSPSLFRDEFGWLWTPQKDAIGEGTPEFAQVHPTRHRECMDKIICQVCGLPAGADAKWIVQALPDRPNIPIVTANAPCCDDCVPLSNDRCPHLRKSKWPTVVAKRVEQYGVIGDAYAVEDGTIIQQGHFTARHRLATQVLARQRAVALRGWRQV